MKNPTNDQFLHLLSPYVDGELNPQERAQVEAHLSASKSAAGLVADFRAGDALMRNALDLQADSVDFKAFTENVMSRVSPMKLPLLERLKVSLSELFTYQRGPMVAAFAGAAAAAILAVPLSLKLATPAGYGAEHLSVQAVSMGVYPNAQIKPVVMETAQGDAVIWVVEGDGKDGGKKKKKDDESTEEELHQEAPKAGQQPDNGAL
jgi:anti-sigma factor RsiW